MIQVFTVCTSAAVARVPGAGGIGVVVLCMRTTVRWAKVIDALTNDDAMRLARVTSGIGAPLTGVAAWQVVQWV